MPSQKKVEELKKKARKLGKSISLIVREHFDTLK